MKFNSNNDNNMGPRTRITQYEKLTKRLGELDAERRKVIKELKGTPEFVTKYVSGMLDTIIKNATWYVRTITPKNAPKQESFFKLIKYSLSPKGPQITKTGSFVYVVSLEWEHFPVGGTEKVIHLETIEISAFNDINKQVFGERTVATKFTEKDAVKKVLNARKADLEAQLKKIKDEISAVR